MALVIGRSAWAQLHWNGVDSVESQLRLYPMKRVAILRNPSTDDNPLTDCELQAQDITRSCIEALLRQRRLCFVVLDFPLTTGFCGLVELTRYALAIPRGADYSKCQWQDEKLFVSLFAILHTLIPIWMGLCFPTRCSRQVSLGAFA